MQLFRVIVPVGDIEQTTVFYSRLLGAAGERVTSGRHYFDCGGVILACWDPLADGDPSFPGPNQGTVYLSTTEDLEAVRARALASGATADRQRGEVAKQPWGELSFYARDPWGNPFCVIADGSQYRGGGFTMPTRSA
jgi:catechol 2,3-dioxygenase-like lactoylglutathione lyase family enzyme